MPQTLDTLSQGLNPLIKDTPIKLSRNYGGLQLAINQGTDSSEQIQAVPLNGQFHISYAARMPVAEDTFLNPEYAQHIASSSALLSMVKGVRALQSDHNPYDFPLELNRKRVPFNAAKSAILAIVDIFKKKLAKN